MAQQAAAAAQEWRDAQAQKEAEAAERQKSDLEKQDAA